jgi:hypothetical protein
MRVVASCLNLLIRAPAARRAVVTGGSGSDRMTRRSREKDANETIPNVGFGSITHL